MDQMQFEAAMKTVISALQAAGYDPYSQLLGYVGTGESAYITRQGGAREFIGVKALAFAPFLLESQYCGSFLLAIFITVFQISYAFILYK